MHKIFSKFLLLFLGTSNILCSTSFECDNTVDCPYFRSRNGSEINTLVLHYTAGNTQRALDYFSGALNVEVSAHYMVDPQGMPYQLVDPQNSSFHAGVSYWNGYENINDNSIGIETVNFGYWRDDLKNKYSQQDLNIDWIESCNRKWACYPAEQINSLIPLVNFIVSEYNIQPRNIVGHSDIAPSRKQDPGPLFPWEELAQKGIGAWPNTEIPLYRVEKPSDLSVSWVQENLKNYGYSVPLNGSFDDETKKTVEAFQMHFDPSTQNFGQIDQNLIDRLSLLVDQYCFGE